MKRKLRLQKFKVLKVGEVTAPENWSSNAVEIAATKYFRRINAKKKEKSVPELISRVSRAISAQVKKQNLIAISVKAFQEKLDQILLGQVAAFNSPVWFNVGLFEAYGIKTQSPHWAWDEKLKKILPVKNNFFKRPQASACFIQSGPENLEQVLQLAETENLLFRYGSGTGSNFTSLPSRHEEEAPGVPSPGILNFLDFLDRGAAMVKSGGVARRAAKMVVMNVDHPEIEEFVAWKKEEERKARTLISQGFDASFEGEVYRFLSGQNANNSVRVTNDFMKKVESDGDWNLKTSFGKVVKKVSAKKLWNQMMDSAWDCADPGIQFHDTINYWNPCSESMQINASNPCSEYMFIDDSACNLASINLCQLLENTGGERISFNVSEYKNVIDILIRSQEALVDYASYPTEKITRNSHEYRPLGLGFANLGALLMRLGLSYDSEEGRCLAGLLASYMTAHAYLTSCEIAKEIGPCVQFKKNKKSFLRVLKQHHGAHKNLQVGLKSLEKKFTADNHFFDELYQGATDAWVKVEMMASQTGVRNSQVTLLAPTGTIGLLMDCDTLGIEPEFSLVKHKVLSGGGEMRIENHSVEQALDTLGKSSAQKNEIFKYLVKNGHLQNAPHLSSSEQKVFACATGPGALTPRSHLLMMAAVQPFLSGAISKTVNCPSNTSIADVSSLYLEAWKLGLKSVAIYRDGSKGSQPLNSIVECGTGECVI